MALGQEGKLSESVTAVAEELAMDETNPFIAELYYDILYELSEDKVRINTGEEKEIARLFFLTGFQVKALADYVRTSGAAVSVYEIANIPGFDIETARMMEPFISFDHKKTTATDTVRFRHTILSNVIIGPVRREPADIGSPVRILMKYRFDAGIFSGGFTAEKDRGEKILYGSFPSPDFVSANLSYRGGRFIKRFIAGDFAVRYGLGTGINSGLKTGYSITSPGNLSVRNEIKPYTSTDENNFFRGVAAVAGVGKLELSLFMSSNRIDATLNDSADSKGASIRSLYTSGYHNTVGILPRKDAVRESSYGINFCISLERMKTGIAFTENFFSIPFVNEITDPAKIYNFEGDRNSNFTFYYSALVNRFILSGETTIGGRNRLAFIQCLSVRPSDRLDISIIYKNFSPGFAGFHSNSPGSGSGTINEKSIAGSFTFEAAKFLFISAGTELKSFPWLRYRCSSPSSSIRYETRISYNPAEKLRIEALYGYRFLMSDNIEDKGIPSLKEIKNQSMKISVKYSPSERLTLTTRLDNRLTGGESGTGVSLLQDVAFRFGRIPLSLWFRYCIYNTGGYASGIYLWENDILNSFSVPVFYGEGSRSYILATWSPHRKADIRIKFGFTERALTGYTPYSSSELKFQVRIFI